MNPPFNAVIYKEGNRQLLDLPWLISAIHDGRQSFSSYDTVIFRTEDVSSVAQSVSHLVRSLLRVMRRARYDIVYMYIQKPPIICVTL